MFPNYNKKDIYEKKVENGSRDRENIIVKLRAVICTYSKNELLYIYLSGSLQSISHFYNLHASFICANVFMRKNLIGTHSMFS